MRGKLPRCGDLARLGQQQRQPQGRLQRFHRDAAGAQQPGSAIQPDDGRFHAHRAGATIDHGVDPPAQTFDHMGGPRGADPARRVGRRCRQRPAEDLKQRARHGMGRDPQRHGRQTRRHKTGQAGPGAQRQDQRQRPRPELGRQRIGARIEDRQPARRRRIGQVHDQRVEVRAPLCRENPRHGMVRPGVTAKAVNRLGRKGDKPALAQKVCRLRDPVRRGGKTCGDWHHGTQR